MYSFVKIRIFYAVFLVMTVGLCTIPTVYAERGGRTENLSILILSPNPLLDKGYKDKLEKEGFEVVCTDYFKTFQYDFLKKFNLVIIDKLPRASGFYGLFGQKQLHLNRTLKALEKYMKNGGGVLIYTNLVDAGGDLAGGWNAEMKKWGIQLKQACVVDDAHSFNQWSAENRMNWTENINRQHPVTAKLKRIYYPSAILRWDDCYTAPPLICDDKWTPIVKSMPGSDVKKVLNHQWISSKSTATSHVLGAVRNVGKGHMAVISICPIYTHRNGYTLNPFVSEMLTGKVNGIILDKGDGKVASDTGKMMLNLYKWLGNNKQDGFGGYKADAPLGIVKYAKTEEEKQFTPTLDMETMRMPKPWQHAVTIYKRGDKTYYPEFADPRTPGKLKFLKALVGVHSVYSDGTGTVKQYVDAAKKAGYSMIVFAENFAKMKPGAYKKLMNECRKYSDKDFFCLPGYEIEDQDRNSMIIAGAPRVPPKTWLTPDGEKLIQVHMVYLTFYNTLNIIHRADSSPLAIQRMKHYQAMSVYSYRDGKMIDNSLSAYMWQIGNASNPHPITVHEVYSPDKVALAAKTGFQQILPSDNITNAAGYFRAGLGHYFGTPARYMISQGPIVDKWVIRPKDMGPAEEHRDQFRVDVGVKSDIGLKSVKIYDGFKLVRKWLPQNRKEFSASAFFRHDRQYDLFVMAEDKSGEVAITNGVRT